MTLVVASAEFSEGNILSFKAFPTQPYPLSFTISFHVAGEVKGGISYRVRKWEDVIFQAGPLPLTLPKVEGQRLFTHADSLDIVFPGQGSYQLDIYFDEALIYTLPFSVYDSSKRADLEREIIYYLKSKRGARSVQEITRGVFNPRVVNKANMRELSGKVYFALLRMKEVTNIDPGQQGSLQDNMNRSRWQLKD